MTAYRRFLVRAAAMAAVLLLCPSGEARPGSVFDGISLPTLSSARPVALASCPTKRCLTVYVAPWCGFCRRSTPMFKKLKESLRWRMVTTRIVVGMDKESAVRGYAREFGGDTLLDFEGALSPRGVPHLFLTDRTGTVIRSRAGAPESLSEAEAWVLQQ